jgi:hypothetical protein
MAISRNSKIKPAGEVLPWLNAVFRYKPLEPSQVIPELQPKLIRIRAINQPLRSGRESPRERDLLPRRIHSWRGSRGVSSDSWRDCVFLKPVADGSNSTLICIGRWVGSEEDSACAKRNARDSAALLSLTCPPSS